MRWSPRSRGRTAIADAQSFLDRIEAGWSDEGGVRHWAVTGAADPDRTYLGTIDLRPAPAAGPVAEVGFALHPEARGHGLMSHACGSWPGSGSTRAATGSLAGRAGRTSPPGGSRGSAGSPPRHLRLRRSPHPAAGHSTSGGASLGRDDPMEPHTPWVDVPVLDAEEGHGIRLRPWRDEDVAALEPRDHPAHFMPARGSAHADTFAGG